VTSRLAAVALAGVTCACATAAKPRAVDLQPARQALEAARAEGAAERAPDTFNRAQGELNEAERLVAARGPEAPLAAVEAEWAARLALAEARCAARDAPAPAAATDDVRRLETRVRRSEDEQRRLEEQIALRQRELDLTENELIRTKARLKGLETRAEASSAIAEARILVKRLEARGRSVTLKLAEESLEKAETQLQADNYGAALFFALKAQDMVTKAVDARTVSEAGEVERPAPQPSYVVVVDTANIRQAPTLQAAVLSEATRGTRLRALAVRGTWLKVSHGDLTGWVSLRVVQ
jgi:Bacterial SH3 domain/Domain of unknown function (DUF4398)